MIMIEKRINRVDMFHRTISIKNDDGKVIKALDAITMTIRERQLLDEEIADNLRVIENEQKQAEELAEQQRAKEREKEALLAQQRAYEEKYSFDNFFIAFNNVLLRLMLGAEPIEDDGSFFLLQGKVTSGEWTIEEAVESHKELKRIFEFVTYKKGVE